MTTTLEETVSLIPNDPQTEDMEEGVAANCPYLLQITNMCLSQDLFPRPWKSAEVVMILKARDKDPALPKSYRPVSLLPVMAKTTERVICARLQDQVKLALSGKQYGFTKNQSTQSAIQDLISWHEERPEKHTVVVLLDITGAFDNLKWSQLLRDIEELGCQNHIKAVTLSYLKDRTASLTLGGVCKTVRLTKGCPQGSLFGPVLWNCTMEKLLNSTLPPYTRIQAYADDIAVSVAGRSRSVLKERAREVLETVYEWGSRRELKFSSTKSTAVLMKSNHLPGFTLQTPEGIITVKECAKYLGVWIDQALNFRTHLKYAVDSDMGLFSRLRGAMGRDWGYSRENANILYRCVFLPKVCYGAKFWSTKTPRAQLINTRNGDYIIKPHNKETADILKAISREHNTILREDNPRRPRIQVDGVQSDVAAESLPMAIMEQNPELGIEDSACINPIFKRGPRERLTVSWIFEVDPQLYGKVVDKFIYIGLMRCKVRRFEDVTQCHQCLRFGHPASKCFEKTPTCSHCGKAGHFAESCQDSSLSPRCSNCGGKHSARDKTCSARTRAFANLLARTDFGKSSI